MSNFKIGDIVLYTWDKSIRQNSRSTASWEMFNNKIGKVIKLDYNETIFRIKFIPPLYHPRDNYEFYPIVSDSECVKIENNMGDLLLI